MWKVFEHHVNYALFPLSLSCRDVLFKILIAATRIEVKDIFEPNNVLMVKLLKDQYFPQRSYGKTIHLGIQLEEFKRLYIIFLI